MLPAELPLVVDRELRGAPLGGADAAGGDRSDSPEGARGRGLRGTPTRPSSRSWVRTVTRRAVRVVRYSNHRRRPVRSRPGTDPAEKSRRPAAAGRGYLASRRWSRSFVCARELDDPWGEPEVLPELHRAAVGREGLELDPVDRALGREPAGLPTSSRPTPRPRYPDRTTTPESSSARSSENREGSSPRRRPSRRPRPRRPRRPGPRRRGCRSPPGTSPPPRRRSRGAA